MKIEGRKEILQKTKTIIILKKRKRKTESSFLFCINASLNKKNNVIK
jgi:hypothetical protein